jgi:solute:Na+ symporter, SSS family
MQRIFSAKSPETARRACFVGAAGTALVGIPYALVALSSGAILGGPADGPVLFAVLDYAPVILTILVLSAIVAASCSTANGVILGTACVAVRNIAGLEQQADPAGGRDPLLRRVRFTMPLVVGIAIFFALRVPETGILLTLAFDLMLAGLVVPFVLGHWWPTRITTAAAAASIGAGVTLRLVFFALTPTFYGVENTLLHVPNDVFGAGFDGWPTLICPLVSLAVFVAVALLAPRRETAAAEPAPATA